MDRITNPQARTGPTELAFHASRIIIDAGVLIVMAAMSMPFVTSEGANRIRWPPTRSPSSCCWHPIFLITMIPNHARPIPMALGWASLVLGSQHSPMRS